MCDWQFLTFVLKTHTHTHTHTHPDTHTHTHSSYIPLQSE